MNLAKSLGVAVASAALTAAGLVFAAVASADDTDSPAPFDTNGMVYNSEDPQEPTDPMNPNYWDSGQHAGSTGAETENDGPSYNNYDQNAGGTGEETGQNDFSIDHGSQEAGAF